MDAGFLSVFEIGQYFMAKDTGDVTQFHAVACREYSLPSENGIITTKRMDQREAFKLDQCWKLRPVACKANMESRLEFGL